MAEARAHGFTNPDDKELQTAVGMSIRLFDCIMPLPPGYILQADKWKSLPNIEIYRSDGLGRIIVGDYEPLNPNTTEVLRETRVGKLTVIFLQGRKEIFRDPPSAALVHDNRTKIFFTGKDVDWAERMAKACLENPVHR